MIDPVQQDAERHCPTLTELPPPPPQKIGWPWTEEVFQFSDTMPDGSLWPRVSVVTPSFNQGQYLEETIRSVLLQGYPNLEYIIIDGGSADNSVEIIRKYERWISFWVSEPDRGQAHAINKGFKKTTGDLLGWINSDDILLPNATEHLALAFCKFPNAILLGDVINYNQNYDITALIRQRNVTFERLVEPWRHESGLFWHQPGTYVPNSRYIQESVLDESLRYLFDLDWMCRLIRRADVKYLGVPIAQFRIHNASKSFGETEKWYTEQIEIVERYGNQIDAFDQSLSYAAINADIAAVHLRLQNWDRRKGIDYLKKALQNTWQSVKLPGFVILCFRAIMPLFVLRWARRLNHVRLKMKSQKA